ncbi:hypothetical protein Glove_53g9 [Diversispora epigaea]|nr:hypothetical protein Glove_53g9 [Diversispora epigaea]
MPGPHRRFLEDLSKIANIRNYIISNIGYDSSEDEEIDNLIKAYNECLAQMKNFRNIHLQIVSVYIVIQENRSKTALPIKKEIITKNYTTEPIKITKPPVMDSIKGTGGTNLIPFLKQMRDETVAQEIPNKY